MNIETFSTAENYIRQQISEGIIPCAIMAARKGKDLRVSILNGQGKPAPELRNQAFLLASITKSIVGTLCAVLHEEGTLRFDEKLSALLPEMSDPVDATTNIGNILTHCTGYSTGVDLIDTTRFTPENYYPEIIRQGRSYQPQTLMDYSTMTYNFISAAVYRKTGRKLPELLQEKICAPAGMGNTSFAPKNHRMPVVDWNKYYTQPVEALMASELAGGGLWSTLDDLLNFSGALLAGKLISSATLQEVTTIKDPLPMACNANYMSARTWGWNKEKCFDGQPDSGFYHGGATGTMLWIDPAQDFTFVFLTNRWMCGNDHAFSILKYYYR